MWHILSSIILRVSSSFFFFFFLWHHLLYYITLYIDFVMGLFVYFGLLVIFVNINELGFQSLYMSCLCYASNVNINLKPSTLPKGHQWHTRIIYWVLNFSASFDLRRSSHEPPILLNQTVLSVRRPSNDSNSNDIMI